MKVNFELALAKVLAHEDDRPTDPGSVAAPTLERVTLAAYQRFCGKDKTLGDLRGLAPGELVGIYKRVWNSVQADELPAGIDYLLFHAALYSNPVHACQWLRIAVDLPPRGTIDAIVLNRLRARSPTELIDRFFKLRRAWAMRNAIKFDVRVYEDSHKFAKYLTSKTGTDFAHATPHGDYYFSFMIDKSYISATPSSHESVRGEPYSGNHPAQPSNSEAPSGAEQFHFLLQGDGARGRAIEAYSRCQLVFRYGVPGPEALQRITDSTLEIARKTKLDLRLEVTARGSIELTGTRSGVARFRNGVMLEPFPSFDLEAGAADDSGSGVHVDFIVRGETVHQLDLPICVADTAAPGIVLGPTATAAAASLPVELLTRARSKPPQHRVILTLSVHGGDFHMGLTHFVNGEDWYDDEATAPDIDAATLASRLRTDLSPLDNCYIHDVWGKFDGTLPADRLTASEQRGLTEALECTAAAGFALWDSLRANHEVRRLLDYIEDENNVPPGATLTIKSATVFLPWELLYPGYWALGMTAEQKRKNPLDPKRFWGARFAVETEILDGQKQGQMRDRHLRSPRRVSVNLNPQITVSTVSPTDCPITDQRNWANELKRKNQLDGQVHDDCDTMRQVLQDGNHQATMIYVYCHGSGAEPFGGPSEFLQLSDECRLTPGNLHDGPLYEAAPVVFLNACNVGAYSPLAYTNFLREFRLRGAIGLIATTHSVPTLFASKFGPEVVDRYLARNGSLAENLLALRQRHLDSHNPVPLFYAVQCQLIFPKSTTSGGG